MRKTKYRPVSEIPGGWAGMAGRRCFAANEAQNSSSWEISDRLWTPHMAIVSSSSPFSF